MNEVHAPASGSLARPSGFDVLSDVLRSVRLTGSMLFLVQAHAPWRSWAPATEAFRRVVLPEAQHLLSYHVVTQGRCCGGLAAGPVEFFEAGDVLVVPRGDAYFLADAPTSPASYGAQEAVAFLRTMAAGELPSVVREGGVAGAPTRLICGFLGCDRAPLNPFLAALPALIHLRAAGAEGARLRHLIDFASGELSQPGSGSRVVLLRLAELMFIEVLRCHLARLAPAEAGAGWLAGLQDPLVGRALALLHAAPQAHWTLAELAARSCASRTVLAGRFARVVGEPPMQYLTRWRMQRATGLLAEPGARKLAEVAQAVGYESPAAFSRAFKKCVGVGPAQWRRRAIG